MKTLDIMVISKPGTRQRLILNLLANYPFLHIKDTVSGSLTALQHITNNCPDLLLIDYSIFIDDIAALITKAKSENDKLQIIVVADTNHQRRKLINAGADFAISSYSCESELSIILEEMMPTTSNKNKINNIRKADWVSAEE